MSDSTRPVEGISLPSRVIVSFKAGAVLAVSNILCVIIFSWAWSRVHTEPKAIGVTGSAKKVIDSDLIVWQTQLSANDPSLQAAYVSLKQSLDKTTAFLVSRGISGSQIEVGSISTVKHYTRDAKGNETDTVTGYELRESIQVTSTDIARVADAARTVTDLIENGVMLESESPQYIYTKMGDLKITMLAEATADATTRANQIALNSGAVLGSIIEARMGVMQINALHSSDATGTGVNDTSSRQKEITAVVSARYGLK